MDGQHPAGLWSVVLDSPDPPALARFYSGLLGWNIRTEEPTWVTLNQPEGPGYLAFQLEDNYVRPTWPAEDGRQRMMMHLDFAVSDLAAAVRSAVEAGAAEAEFQPQDDVRVMLDPDGHPFCLWHYPETAG